MPRICSNQAELAVQDIQERCKRAEEALCESQERFRQLAENIQEVFWMSDPEKNRIMYISPGYEDIWGRSCESLYASPRSWLEAIHPDDRDRVLQAALTKQVTGTYDEEYRIVHPNGSIRWIWDRAFPIRDASGHVYRITGIAEDITERKRVERELRASEERLELAVRGSSDGLWDGRPLPGEPWDSPHTPVWYSPRFKAMLGFEEQEFDNVLGSWIALLHQDDMERVFVALSAHIERKEPYDVEYRLRTKQGEYRWFRSRGQAIWDEAGNLLRIAGSLQCITDRKRAEQRLRAQYATVRALEESATLWEAAPKILRALCECLGWDFGALWDMDREANELQCIDCWYGASAEFAEFASVSRDFRFSPGDGLPGRVWTSGKPAWITNVQEDTNFPREAIALKAGLRGATGFPILQGDQILGVIEFLSREVRQPDDEQIEMMAAIGGQIGQFVKRKRHADQLVQAERLASLGTLISGMAHEVNNPAQAILGMAEIILEETAPEKIKEYALDIVCYSQHIATVVRDFVSYARPTVHDGQSEIDLNDRLREALRMVRRGPDFGRVEVVTESQPLPPIRAHRAEIDQVFINLISNAVQSMKGKGKLTLATRLQGGSVVASISDAGCGIPKAQLHRIFDPFFTTKEPGKGTGLGLSIVYTIVAKYGGKISVESEEGRGTTFTITFPVNNSQIKQEVPNV